MPQEDTPCQGRNQNKGPVGRNILWVVRHHREACVLRRGKRQRGSTWLAPPLEDFYSEGDCSHFTTRSKEGTSSGPQGSCAEHVLQGQGADCRLVRRYHSGLREREERGLILYSSRGSEAKQLTLTVHS